MRSPDERNVILDDDHYLEVRLLSEVERMPEISQRSLAQRLGVALGLTNFLVRGVAEKGYVRVAQAGWKRWVYALTPAGLSRKAMLTMSYVQRVLGQYQWVRETVRSELGSLELHKESRVAVYGHGEIAELTCMVLRELGVEEIDLIAPSFRPQPGGSGAPVYDGARLAKDGYDRVVLALLEDPEQVRRQLGEAGVPERAIVPLFARASIGVEPAAEEER